jgi:hypothetical protein
MTSRNRLGSKIRKTVFSFCLIILAPGAKLFAEDAVPVSGPNLNSTLMSARKSVESFWKQFGSVTCLEKVTQEKLGEKDKVEYEQKSTFDYPVLLNMDKDALIVEESRLQQGKKGKPKNIPLLITNGIPTLLLVFHPLYGEDFRYQLTGEELTDGNRLAKIRFEHIPGMRSTTALQLRGKDHPLDLEGTAWIDPEDGSIHRIIARIAVPMDDLNLKALDMDVRYDLHQFPSPNDAYRLPSTATINVKTRRRHWRNVHQYSNYKRFTINTEDKILK